MKKQIRKDDDTMKVQSEQQSNSKIKYKKMKILFFSIILFGIILLGGFSTDIPTGTSFHGESYTVSDIEFLHDLTYEKDGKILHEQTIFDEQLALIKRAQEFIIVDMFLFNDDYNRTYDFPKISENLTKGLIKQKKKYPDLKILFITDEINNFYGSYESNFITNLKKHDIHVVITDLTKMPDSNPLYSGFWRTFIEGFGNEGTGWITHPFNPDSSKVTLRSYLKLLNFKANHRKILITEEAAIVTSANPHDASGYHSNIAFKVKGDIIGDLIQSELAVAKFSGSDFREIQYKNKDKHTIEDLHVSLITEGKIRKNLVNEIKDTKANDQIHMGMFYLSDRFIIEELINAANRGVNVRLILDPNKDAFGMKKNGIPNRVVASELRNKSSNDISIKWYDTHGEQYHAKLTLIKKENESIIIGGSANLTRRNIGDYNLETNLKIEVSSNNNKLVSDVTHYFDRIWNNKGGYYTANFCKYKEKNLFKYFIYRFQEWSGLSTF